MESLHEQGLARTEQDASQGNAGAAHPLAPGTPGALRLPESAEELVAFHRAQEIAE
jgi:hypothetical protein